MKRKESLFPWLPIPKGEIITINVLTGHKSTEIPYHTRLLLLFRSPLLNTIFFCSNFLNTISKSNNLCRDRPTFPLISQTTFLSLTPKIQN